MGSLKSVYLAPMPGFCLSTTELIKLASSRGATRHYTLRAIKEIESPAVTLCDLKRSRNPARSVNRMGVLTHGSHSNIAVKMAQHKSKASRIVDSGSSTQPRAYDNCNLIESKRPEVGLEFKLGVPGIFEQGTENWVLGSGYRAPGTGRESFNFENNK